MSDPEGSVFVNVETASVARRVVVVDIGKAKRGKVRKLKKGEGPLMKQVQEVTTSLAANKVLAGEVEPVVVLVVEKRARKRLGLLR